MPNLQKLRKNINAYKLVVNAYIVDSSLIEILRPKKITSINFESAKNFIGIVTKQSKRKAIKNKK